MVRFGNVNLSSLYRQTASRFHLLLLFLYHIPRFQVPPLEYWVFQALPSAVAIKIRHLLAGKLITDCFTFLQVITVAGPHTNVKEVAFQVSIVHTITDKERKSALSALLQFHRKIG